MNYTLQTKAAASFRKNPEKDDKHSNKSQRRKYPVGRMPPFITEKPAENF